MEKLANIFGASAYFCFVIGFVLSLLQIPMGIPLIAIAVFSGAFSFISLSICYVRAYCLEKRLAYKRRK